jgi:hypothetical protein
MRLVSEVESCLDRPPDRNGCWLGCLIEKLPVLTETLRAHFEGEQRSTLYCEIPIRFPRYAERLTRLATEHDEIIELALVAHERAKTLHGAEVHDLRQFNARVQLLIARIRRHEAEENEIMMRAYWNELGGEGN